MQTIENQTYYTRWEHGQHQVVLEQNSWKYHHPSGTQSFNDERLLLAAIFGKKTNISLARYFRLGKYKQVPTPLTPQSFSTLSLFSNTKIQSSYVANRKSRPAIKTFRPITGTGSIRIKPPGPTRTSASTLELLASIEKELELSKKKQQEKKLGIDLKNRSHEVKKLLYAGFGKRIYQLGYDPEDVLQEVYRGLLARNEGKCPWDESKSSFGHYVHMVCGCILSNYHRKYSRIQSRETTGVMGFNEAGEFREMDAALSLACHTPATQGNEMYNQALLGEIRDKIKTRFIDVSAALEILPLLIDGYTRRQISRMLGIREGEVGKIIKRIQAIAIQLWGKKKEEHMVSELFMN